MLCRIAVVKTFGEGKSDGFLSLLFNCYVSAVVGASGRGRVAPSRPRPVKQQKAAAGTAFWYGEVRGILFKFDEVGVVGEYFAFAYEDAFYLAVNF